MGWVNWGRYNEAVVVVVMLGENRLREIYPLIEYKISSFLMGESDDWISEINGEVFNYTENDEKEVIGKCRHFFIDLENSEETAHDLLDIRNELDPYVCMYEENTTSFTDDVLTVCKNDVWNSNLLIIDRIEVLPNYRGHGLAKTIIDDAINLFSPRTDVIALKAYPLQLECKVPEHCPKKWERLMNLKALEMNEAKAEQKLMAYYETLGFISIDQDGVMVKSNV